MFEEEKDEFFEGADNDDTEEEPESLYLPKITKRTARLNILSHSLSMGNTLRSNDERPDVMQRNEQLMRILTHGGHKTVFDIMSNGSARQGDMVEPVINEIKT